MHFAACADPGAARIVSQVWLFPLSGLLGCALTYLVWRVIESRRIHDIPNDRSMHTRPLAIGAGWAIVGCVLTLWPWTSTMTAGQTILITAAMLILACIGWQDDRTPLSPLLRLVLQAAIVAICLASLPGDALVLRGYLPAWLDRFLTALCWLWFINLFNFMDGIDGITGTETVFVALGYALLAALIMGPGNSSSLAFILAGSALGFLVWNWNPARIILGDVGSIPLGFLLGWLMLDLGLRGHLAAALILPLYHIADATLTLVHRIFTVPAPWKPHRQHFYQRAVLAGLRPPQVVVRIAVLNGILIALAVVSLTRPWLAIVCAGTATSALLIHLGRAGIAPSQR
jgi:UDP-N-acetylmuramyl pentapeptide phosphotransferase/UDP-N-acetylglucosamine-1-phosphate transferase